MSWQELLSNLYVAYCVFISHTLKIFILSLDDLLGNLSFIVVLKTNVTPPPTNLNAQCPGVLFQEQMRGRSSHQTQQDFLLSKICCTCYPLFVLATYKYLLIIPIALLFSTLT